MKHRCQDDSNSLLTLFLLRCIITYKGISYLCTCLISVYVVFCRYDTKTNHWTSVEPMKTKRKHLGTAVLDNLLYAIGGRDENTELNSVEKYDPTTNQWSSVVAMNFRRSGVGLAVVNGHLYAVGGFDGSNYLKSVEWFDPAINQWKIAGSMNYRRLGGGVGVLKLPETS